MNVSRDGSGSGRFTPEELAATQAKGTIVLAYFSIGQAETYRDYRNPAWVEGSEPSAGAPACLGPADSDWPDNFEVRYLDPEWQSLLLGPDGPLAEIQALGFDGVYLDRIDAYEFWEVLPDAGPPEQGPQMAGFVRAVADAARAGGRPEFLVVVQNSSGILNALTTSQTRAYLAAIDGLAVEDTFYLGPLDENNLLAPDVDRLGWIRQIRDAGKPVLAVDYLTDPTLQREFVDRAQLDGLIPLVAVRALDRVLVQPPR